MSADSGKPYSINAPGHYDDPVFGRVWIKETEDIISSDTNLVGKYCSKPFTWAEIDMHGRVWLCCPSWLPYPIGNILENTLEELWNNEKAQTLRNQIFTGDWKYCQHKFCPLIQSNSLDNIEDIINGKVNHVSSSEIDCLINKKTKVGILPTQINFSNDESCNLKCPSCRVDKILHTTGELYDKRKIINDKIVESLFNTPTDRTFSIFVTGSGDPFASKIFRNMLMNIDGDMFPNLSINLQTNGTMFTSKMWDQLYKVHKNLKSIRISFDAASQYTYENKTRIGGNWDLLLKNCDFLNDKCAEYSNLNIVTDFVIQKDNFNEIPEYVNLVTTRYPNFNEIAFSLVTDWGTWDKDIYNDKCIWKTNHPQFNDFLDVMGHPNLTNRKIMFGNSMSYRQKAIEKIENARI